MDGASLPYEIGHYALFRCRPLLTAICDAFYHPGHVPSYGPHGLHALPVKSGFPGKASVHIVPIECRDYRHVVDGEIFVEPVECGGSPASAADCHRGGRLVLEISPERIEHPVQKGAYGAVRTGVIYRGAYDKPVNPFFKAGPDSVIYIVLEYAVSEFCAFPAGDAAPYGMGAD